MWLCRENDLPSRCRSLLLRLLLGGRFGGTISGARWQLLDRVWKSEPGLYGKTSFRSVTAGRPSVKFDSGVGRNSTAERSEQFYGRLVAFALHLEAGAAVLAHVGSWTGSRPEATTPVMDRRRLIPGQVPLEPTGRGKCGTATADRGRGGR